MDYLKVVSSFNISYCYFYLLRWLVPDDTVHKGTTYVFPYLGRNITYNNSDWADVFHNLR